VRGREALLQASSPASNVLDLLGQCCAILIAQASYSFTPGLFPEEETE